MHQRMVLGMFCAVGLSASLATAQDNPVAKAIEFSKQTGTPILAVAGSST